MEDSGQMREQCEMQRGETRGEVDGQVEGETC